VCDPKTLEAVSLVLGEYDRRLVSSTIGVTKSSTGMFGDVTTAKSGDGRVFDDQAADAFAG
jgi:hypothetical protein